MKLLKQLLIVITTSSLLCSTTVNATLLTWDFTIMVDNIYSDDANVIDDSIVVGTLLSGSFAYDNGLIEDSPGNDYVDNYADPKGTITISGLGIHDWDIGLSVVHQSSRDIVDLEGEYRLGNIWENIEIGFLDYTQSYNNGVLPANWHNLPVAFSDIDFDYTYDVGTDPCCYDSWLTGHVSSIALRPSADVPEPSTLAILALGMMGFASRRCLKQS